MSGNNSSSTPGVCLESITNIFMYTIINLIGIFLVLPLSTSVLCLGLKQWRRLGSVSSPAVVSFSDFVTYNMAFMELIGIMGTALTLCGAYTELSVMARVGFHVGVFPWYGQMVFPILTCVERYLAVVHPINYLRLKQAYGIRIRNISVIYVWLQCFFGVGALNIILYNTAFNLFMTVSQMMFYLIATAFCSVSVLRVLIRPRPGEASGHGARVDQSKLRAFHVILVIMGVLLLRFGGNLACILVGAAVDVSAQCFMNIFQVMLNLPSSLVLPLLFLHKAGKLQCRKLKILTQGRKQTT